MEALGLSPIRSIGRGLAVLGVISREQSSTMMQIARATALPYPTVCRIVHTLVREGYVEQEPDQKRFRVTALVQSLAHGFQDHSRLTQAARGHLVALTEQTHWPFTVSTRMGTNMIVRDSTHALTSLTLNRYYPGYVFPIIDSASGLAYMAFADEREQTSILDLITDEDKDESCYHAVQLARSGALFADIRASGYAIRERNMFAMPPGKNSSIAAPIFKDGCVHAVISIIFFGAAMSAKKVAELYADTIIRTAAEISETISEQHDPSHHHDGMAVPTTARDAEFL